MDEMRFFTRVLVSTTRSALLHTRGHTETDCISCGLTGYAGEGGRRERSTEEKLKLTICICVSTNRQSWSNGLKYNTTTSLHHIRLVISLEGKLFDPLKLNDKKNFYHTP